MKQFRLIMLAVLAGAAIGCHQDAAQVVGPSDQDRAASQPPTPVTSATAEPEAVETGYWDRVTTLYERAKASGETSAASTRDWISELYDSTKSSGQATASDTSAWVRGLCDQAKETGETSAENVQEWVMDDIEQIGSWQYKTLQVHKTDGVDAVKQLNQMGTERWECFWVDQQEDTTTFYLKKAGRSYLRHLPSEELIRLLPLLGAARGSSE